MEKRNLLENLLNKYLHGNLTISERRQLNDLFADDSNEALINRIILNHLTEFTDENSFSEKTVDFDEIYNKILLQLDIENRNPATSGAKLSPLRKILLISAAAAVLAMVFMLGRIFPDPQANPGIPDTNSYTEVKSPYGSRSEIKLADGTSVILNAGSTLKYRNDFNQSNRDLDLYGEAYFIVAKNPDIPFIVSAGYIEVIATGTEFNIKAYPEENTIETTLIEGSVEISNMSDKLDEELVNLAPNQKAIFIKGEDEYLIENTVRKEKKPEPLKPVFENILISPKADVEKTVAWTQGKLIFRSENLQNLCVDLQRKYDVKFIFIEEDLKKFHFTGALLDETLEQVLNVIKLTAPIDYLIEAKTVYLFTDPVKLKDFKEHMKQKE